MKTPIRVLVVCPWFYRGDAVGEAARRTVLALSNDHDFEVCAIATLNDFDDIDVAICHGVGDLLLHPLFMAADVIIYVFAIYHPFFDALILGNGNASQIVRFHNVTPKALMPPQHHPVIDKSFRQMQTFQFADEIWADSRENAEELLRQGLPGERVEVVAIAAPPPIRARLADKKVDRIRMAYVGRFFPSKGVLDLIDMATCLENRENSLNFELRLYGNLRFSDPGYVEAVKDRILASPARSRIQLVGSVSDQQLAEAYRTANIFVTGSRHEGFCVPVIEALAAGCVPVSYPVTNLRYVANDLGRLSRGLCPQDLADAALEVSQALIHSRELPLDRGATSVEDFDKLSASYIDRFSLDSFAKNIIGRTRRVRRQSVWSASSSETLQD